MGTEPIAIDDWESFLQSHEEVENVLNACAEHIANMVANINTVKSMAEGVNNSLSGLIHTSSIPRIDSGLRLEIITNKFVDYFTSRSFKIITCMTYMENVLKAYNEGREIDPEEKSTFEKIINGAMDAGFFWILSEALANCPNLKALSFLGAYTRDACHDGANFVFGDLAKNGSEQVMKWFNTDIHPLEKANPWGWINTTIGSVVVVGWAYFREKMNDKGEITELDKKRWGWTAAFAGLSYAEWVTISGAIGNAIAGPLGGAVGAAVASLVAIPTSILFNKIVDRIVGDDIIDTFDFNGVPIEVPRNGNGKNGTFDVITENYNDLAERSNMYYDIDQYLINKLGDDLDDYYRWGFDKSTIERFKEIITKAVEFDNYDDAYWYYMQEMGYLDYDVPPDLDDLEYLLNLGYGFNLEEYYNLMHGGGSDV